jgi:hypothetical protein
MSQTTLSRTVGDEFSYTGVIDTVSATSLLLTGSSGSAAMQLLITEIKISEKQTAALFSLADWVAANPTVTKLGNGSTDPLRIFSSASATCGDVTVVNGALWMDNLGNSTGVEIYFGDLGVNLRTSKYQLFMKGYMQEKEPAGATTSGSAKLRLTIRNSSRTEIAGVGNIDTADSYSTEQGTPFEITYNTPDPATASITGDLSTAALIRFVTASGLHGKNGIVVFTEIELRDLGETW